MDDFIRPKRPKLGLSETPKIKNTDAFVSNKDEAPEPDFVPPEELAETENNGPLKPEGPKSDKPKKGFFKKRLTFFPPHGKKQWIIFSMIALLFLGGVGSAWWFLIRGSTDRTVTEVKEEPYEKPVPKPTTVASKLSGLQVDPSVNERQVTGVMIENSLEARPQSGLKDASVVFEAVAEGGITRFLALYQDIEPDYVGPIRSVRPYYLDWFLPFDAAIAHVGGSPKALSDIKSTGAKDLDQFANSGSYTRITQRYAPHNVYTSIAKLNELEEKKGFNTANFTGFERKEEKAAATPTARTIDLDISSTLYNVHYDYDVGTNTYKRSEGGKPHLDERSGAQLAPKVVVAIVMQRGIDADGQHTAYTTTGSGKVFVFQDGVVSEGTWSKTSRTAQWKFTDANGNTLTFNPGQTWLAMVDTPGSVTFQP